LENTTVNCFKNEGTGTAMSDGVFGRGSVVSFVPCTGWQFRVHDDAVFERNQRVVPVIGWAVVVTARSVGGLMDTALHPVVVLDGVLTVCDMATGQLIEG
jgi:hypothetical protein